MAKKSTSEKTSPIADFEQSMQALEELVGKMEAGDLSLEASLEAYERGVALYRHCQSALEQAELRIRVLSDPSTPEHARDFSEPSDAPF
jgi:exodeoxyribonuclease VII small subunit